jgi:opacity protein-like surface antigen
VLRLLFGVMAIVALAATGPAVAGDAVQDVSRPAPPQHTWNGFYVGLTAGAAWGQYDPRTSTDADGYLGPPAAAAVGAAGSQTIKSTGFVTGIEGGHNWQSGNLLLGVEADLQAVNLQGATNSGAVPGQPGRFVVTSYGNTDWLFTARPRIGFVAPNNWLFYATGGLALTQLQSNFSFVDANPALRNTALESGRLDSTKAGYAIGGGVEAPLTSRLSLKADYLHVDFANTSGMVTGQASFNPLPLFSNQIFAHSSDLKADIVRAGLNYRFGGADVPPRSDPIMPLKAPVWKAHPAINTDWEVETGARLWFSSGTLRAPSPTSDSTALVYGSRLTFSGLDAVSGETFARVDHASGLFVKGFLGAGGIANGRLNDEDTLAQTPYSNTLSSASGQIAYGTADIGYNFLRSPGAKVGAFVGYNYYAQALNTYGCTQIAGGTTACVPALPSSLLGISETDHSNSLRVGLSSELVLDDRFKLTTDVAHLPWVTFGGVDDHIPQQVIFRERSNGGDGVMLEALLDYKITEAWRIGVGGRYWAWNMNTGTFTATPLAGGAPLVEHARFDNERYGLLVQTSYHWGDTLPSDASVGRPTKAPVIAAAPMNWSGFYIGGHMGGGWSDDRWSDPFGSTPGVGGVNVAGFGDQTHATGPLGGAQIGANWQTGPWVLGVQTDVSAAHMRGENTCFTGLGGVDCQRVVNSLGTIAGRLGYAWDRSLAYVKGGGAWTETTYNLFANTLMASLGTGSTALDTWGWTLGGGIEYALTEHWTALAEYDHIGLPTALVPFPMVAVINAQSIRVNQSVDLLKLGVNYKFDLASLGTTVARR